MSDVLTVNVEGLEPLMKRMSVLPKNLQKRGLAAAARKGAAVIRDAAKKNAQSIDDPETANQIAKNIAVQTSARQGKRVGGAVARVGVRGGAKKTAPVKRTLQERLFRENTEPDKGNPGGDTWYWRFVEFGTSRTRAQPFLRPAGEQSRQPAFDATAVELEKQLEKLELL